MSSNYNKYHNEYMLKYKNTYFGKYSIKISNIKRSCKFKNNIPNSRLTLTTNEFLQILELFNYCCAYCGSKTELIPSLIVRFSMEGDLDRFNTVCSCLKCSQSKLNKRKLTFHQWYISQSFYSQDRYNKIIEHTKRE